MYPRNAVSPERLAIGAVVQISDGAVQTAGIVITYCAQGGAEGAATNAADVGASGVVYYTPTQAEANVTSFVLTAGKTGCIPVSITVVTSASEVPGFAGVDWLKLINPTAANNLSASSIGTATDLGATGIASLLNTAVDGTLTLAQVLRILSAVDGGQVSGFPAGPILLKNAAGTKTRVSATVDGAGNRTAITNPDVT